MAKRGIKKKDHERLDDSTVGRVVSFLEQEKPITKKEACEFLNITYNTTRLNKIIKEYKEKQEFIKLRKEQNKGKPLSDPEVKELVLNYLCGESMTVIASRLYRTVHVIKGYINKLKLPARAKTVDYTNPSLIPDENVGEEFAIKELAWSARYNCVVEIHKHLGKDKEFNSNIYRIWIFGKFNQFGIQPAYELGKLEVLKTLSLSSDEFQINNKLNLDYAIG